MDKKTKIRLGFEKSISEQIHDDLFKTTSEYQYYLLGVSQGLFSIYSMFNHLVKKDTNLTAEESLLVIKNSALQDIKIGEYFNMFIKDLLEEDNENKK